MNTVISQTSRKRSVNLTLNEELVAEAKKMTGNLSGIVEQLLDEYVQKQRTIKRDNVSEAAKISKSWNQFNEQHGSFADEHSSQVNTGSGSQ